jgi:hypothetical protein
LNDEKRRGEEMRGEERRGEERRGEGNGGRAYSEFREPRHNGPQALAVLVVVLEGTAERLRENSGLARWSAEGHDELEVPGIVGVDDGFGGCFLGGESGHVGWL